jgi:hypothetical protein
MTVTPTYAPFEKSRYFCNPPFKFANQNQMPCGEPMASAFPVDAYH